MTEQQSLILGNVLNGVSIERVAADFNVSQADVLQLFTATMRAVAEYRLVHCVPHFECGDVHNAYRNRIQVIGILAAIERWDAFEREIMLDLFKGKGVGHHGLPRAELETILKRTMDAVPNYLLRDEQAAFFRDSKAFIANRRSRLVAVLEQFVSLTEPLKYKRIEHISAGAENFTEVGAQIAAELSTRKERSLQ